MLPTAQHLFETMPCAMQSMCCSVIDAIASELLGDDVMASSAQLRTNGRASAQPLAATDGEDRKTTFMDAAL